MKTKHKCQSCDNPSKFRKLANTVSLNGLLNYSTDVLFNILSLILSKLLLSLRLPKFEILYSILRLQTHFCSLYIMRSVWKTFLPMSLLPFNTIMPLWNGNMCFALIVLLT